MKILLVGGTGVISSAVSRRLLASGHELWLINRGNRLERLPEGAHLIRGDINDLPALSEALAEQHFDCVADFTVQKPDQIERDYRLFAGKTRQYVFISSACVYQKPLSHYEITESTPVCNPYWEYAQNKIACENKLMELYRSASFPITIIRPGHTYDEEWLPLCITGERGGYSVIKRMLEEKPTIIPGDGTSLWTLTHNSDFARAFEGLAGNPYALGETVHITSDEVLTWNQIYETIADALGVPLHPFYVSSLFLHQAGPYDLKSCLLGERVRSCVFRNDKLKRLVPGFRAEVPFRKGIRMALNHILQHPELQKEDPLFDRWCDALAASLSQTAKELRQAFSIESLGSK
jgi:nucleoside-diphosphate-sugar epimerase